MNLTVELEEKLQFVLSTIAEHRKDLKGWDLQFYDDIAKRFDEHGSKTFVSPKQWAQLNRIYDMVTDV